MYTVQAYCNEPCVLAETEDYAVVYKPPFIHSVPLKKDEGEKFPTLLDWYGRIRPGLPGVSGRKEWEGGLLHRLDYETEGPVLIAKNQGAMDAILAQQEQGLFVKEYGAISLSPGADCSPLPGFPPRPVWAEGSPVNGEFPLIKSYFRPWGPGRRAVRPVVTEPGLLREKQRRNIAADQGKPYVTEVLETGNLGEGLVYFRLGIKRGFRHQIRCHLSWIGRPILNDALYGGMIPPKMPRGTLALRAEGFSFFDPSGGEKREYRIPPLSGQTI
ncbi:RNA pseudouridine synthase [Spirochaetia bacterium]|nr:RNA pseudouridine synthase [Spirochaetia bacterium]